MLQKPPNIIPYFTVNIKTVFLPLRHLYSSCFSLIADEPKLHPLICLKTECHRNNRCAEALAKRVYFWFDKIEPESKLLVAYFKYQDKPNSIRAGIFHKDMREPYVITLNISAFNKFRSMSQVKTWAETSEYSDIDNTYKLPGIIPVDSLVRKL